MSIESAWSAFISLLSLEAIYPKPKTTLTDQQHKIHPYLLRDSVIERVHQVYSTDITYIRLNVFVERLWRSVKYECIYLQELQDVRSARDELGRYFEFYNNEGVHQV